MADIFLSYAHEDLAKAQMLAAALEKQGWSVFWDRSSILPGQDFDLVIEQAIESAACMIVLWSEFSRKSHYVRDEARLGRDRNILVPVLADSVSAPLGFGSIHAENFSQWQGDVDSGEFRKLCGAVTRLLGDNSLGEPLPTSDPVHSNDVSSTVKLNSPSHFIEKLTNMLGQTFEPEMVVIPAGSFRMGGTRSDQRPIHTVTIAKPFALGKYPVTFAEYDVFAEQAGEARPSDEGWGRDSRPVINVCWDEARRYAAWLAQTTGKNYRLPSEAEWEYAVRAGNTGKYYWDGQGQAKDYAWFSENSQGRTQPVGSLKANSFGLYDMAGNVWEWLEDCWHDNYDFAPDDGSAWESRRITQRVLRGGSWLIEVGALCSANRNRTYPDYRYANFGFRVAQDLP